MKRTYSYRCQKCGQIKDFQAYMNDIPSEKICECGGVMKKLLSSCPVIYKCDGFYSTDYRDKR